MPCLGAKQGAKSLFKKVMNFICMDGFSVLGLRLIPAARV